MRIASPNPTAPSEDSPASAEGDAPPEANVVVNGVAAAPHDEHVPRPSQQFSPENLVGTVLADRYRLIKLIGEGGMGSVYQAEHITIGRKLAIKVLAPEYCDSPDVVARFLQEARTASMLHHEHIVDITDFGYTKQGLAFLTMEYLEGEDLATLLAREGRQPWTRVRRMMLQICRALDAAHEKGIVHRDMKPDNCFRIKRGGNHDFIKILDFGIAKVIVDGQNPTRADKPKMATEAGTLLGTPEYMAPEIARDQKADARVDVYSLGVVMYELLTGSVPFKGQTFMATVAMQMVDEPQPPRKRAPEADIPEAIEQVVLRALKKDPADRFQSVREFADAIIDADRTLRYTSQAPLEWDPDVTPDLGAPPPDASFRIPAAVLNATSSQILRPSTAQLQTLTQPPAPAPETTQPQQLADDEPSALTRSNPYRVLTVLLLLVVAGLGGAVYYLLNREPTAPEAPKDGPAPVADSGGAAEPDPSKAEPDKKGDEPKKGDKGEKGDKGDKGDEPKKDKPDKGDGDKTPKKGSNNVPATQAEQDDFFSGFMTDVRRCASLHEIAGGAVKVLVTIESGTGKVSADMKSHRDKQSFGDCIIKAFEKKRFKKGRDGFVYDATYNL